MVEVILKSKLLKNYYVTNSAFYSQVIDSLQDYSVITLDRDLIINSWSIGAANVFGYLANEVIGEPFDFLFTKEDRRDGIPKKIIDEVRNEGKAVDNRWHVSRDGNKFFANGLVYPLIGLNGEMLGYVKVIRDLTDKRKFEEGINAYIKELEELNTHKNSILAILSHDLRSPLASIISAADYLRLNIEDISPEDAKELLDLLYKKSTEELNMLDNLLEWARIKYAADSYNPKKTDLSICINKVFEILNDAASLNSLKLHHKIQENTFVFVDEKMLVSILQNIASNAIKYSKKGGIVSISAEKSEDKLIVAVTDSGGGMSQEILNQLFFPQLSSLSTARKQNKGAGIGLLIVKGLLEKNGGDIWVESKEGTGSTFYFTLPLEKPKDKQAIYK
jgi:PAS domain S-box-containing protein